MICSKRRTFDQLRWKLDKSQICSNSWPLSDGRHYSTCRCAVSLWEIINRAALQFLMIYCTFSVNVRLGDHDLSLHKNCAGRHCGNPMRVNEIDEVIPHESFSPRAINRRHDIGLIRLKASVQFSSEKTLNNTNNKPLISDVSGLVRPICLPNPSFPGPQAGEPVYVTGFGRTLYAKTSTIKQKLTLPVFDHSQCRTKFAAKKVDVTNEQLCAGGEFSRDACDGGERIFLYFEFNF